jgi:hypothetical protein
VKLSGDHRPSMQEALGSFPSSGKKKKDIEGKKKS